jgi:hypothetical protein
VTLFKSNVERAEAELASARRLLSNFESEASNLASREGAELDFNSRFELGEDRARIERKIAAARGEIERCGRNLTAARVAEAKAERDRQHKEGDKLVRADVRLTENVEAAAQQLAAALAAQVANQQKIDALNAARGDRPFIVNGERRLRETPGRTIPAQFEEREVWREHNGELVGQFKQHPETGELVPARGGVKSREKVQVRAEQIVPAHMPTPYAQAIVLVDRKGQRIWPPAR